MFLRGLGSSSARWLTQSLMMCVSIMKCLMAMVGWASLRSPNGICTIKHPHTKHQPIALPPSLILPLLPHKRAGRMSLAAQFLRRHDSAHHDSDKHAQQYQDESNIGDDRQCAVGKHDEKAARPVYNQKRHEDVPALVDVIGMEEAVHGYDLVGEDGAHAGRVKDPSTQTNNVSMDVGQMDMVCCVGSLTIRRSST